jgi:hypothetical protein
VQAKVNDGYIFSNSEIDALLAQFPELEGSITGVAGGWQIEADALRVLLGENEVMAQEYINAQNTLTIGRKTALPRASQSASSGRIKSVRRHTRLSTKL